MQNSKIASITRNVLRNLGIHQTIYSGFDYIVAGISLMYDNRDSDSYPMKCLYIDVAKELKTTVYSVERNIRTVISTIWNYRNEDLLKKIFYEAGEDRPTNKAFLDDLYNYVVRRFEGQSSKEDKELTFKCPLTDRECEYLCDIYNQLF